MAVNFGILQPQVPQSNFQLVQPNNFAAQNALQQQSLIEERKRDQAQEQYQQGLLQNDQARTAIAQAGLPGILAQNQLTQAQAKSAQMDMQKRQAVMAAMTKAASGGLEAQINAGIAATAPYDPKAALDMQISQQQYHQLSQSNRFEEMGQIGTAVMSAQQQNPQHPEQAFAGFIPELKKMLGPTADVSFPDPKSPTYAKDYQNFAGITMGYSQLFQDQIKNSWDMAKQIAVAQIKAQPGDMVVANKIAQLETTPNLTPEQQAQLKELRLTQANNPKNIYDAKIADSDQKILDASRTTRDTATSLYIDTTDAAAILKKIPSTYTGPLVDYLKANHLDSDVQMLQKIQSEIPFLLKSLVMSGSMRFTQGELQQLNKAAGTTAMNRDTLQYVIDREHDEAANIVMDKYHQEKNIRANGSDELYKTWLQLNPTPNVKLFKDSSYTPLNGATPTEINGTPSAPRTAENPLPAANNATSAAMTKVVDGVTYHYVNGQWGTY